MHRRCTEAPFPQLSHPSVLVLLLQGYQLSENEIAQFMRKVDFDHDGTVSLSEFVTTLLDWDKLQRDAIWQAYIDHAFNKLDENGDGSITLEELIHVSAVHACPVAWRIGVSIGGGGGAAARTPHFGLQGCREVTVRFVGCHMCHGSHAAGRTY